MLEWLKKEFEFLFVVCAWIALLLFSIGGLIGGIVLGQSLIYDRDAGIFFGGLIGLVFGWVLFIDIFGLLAIFILMAKKVDSTYEKLDELVSCLKPKPAQ